MEQEGREVEQGWKGRWDGGGKGGGTGVEGKVE